MGSTNSAKRNKPFCCLSGSVVVYLMFQFGLPDIAGAQEAATNDPHYRLAKKSRPRLGKLLDAQTVSVSGKNFRFCDGEEALVDIAELVVSKEVCDEHREGTFGKWARALSLLEPDNPIPLYNADYEIIGQITSLQAMAGTENSYLITDLWIGNAPEYLKADFNSLYQATDKVSPENSEEVGVGILLGSDYLAFASNEDGGYEIILRPPNIEQEAGNIIRVWEGSDECQNFAAFNGNTNFLTGTFEENKNGCGE